MSNLTHTPSDVQNAVYALKNYLGDQDQQVFWAPLGAVVLTDNEVYEVYSYDDGIIVQSRDFQQADGWDDITTVVLR